MNNTIIEKKLGIRGDYQFRALTRGFWLQRFWHRNKFSVLHRVLQIRKNADVLDLGTGSGNFELLFHNHFRRIIGVDYNDEALLFLRGQLSTQKINNVDLVHADIRKMPPRLTRSKFDAILIMDTIEHIKKRDAVKIVKLVKKMLATNGQFIVVTPNYKSLWVIIENFLDKLTIVPKFAGKQHLSKFDSKSLVSILKKEGFTSIKSSSFNLFSFLSPFGVLNNALLGLELNHIGNAGCLVCVTANK